MTAPNRIELKGSGRKEEKIASGAITPGHLVKVLGNNTVVVHATAQGPAQLMIALENALEGENIDSAYAAGDLTFINIPDEGDWFYGLRKASIGDVAVGDLMASAGDGTFDDYVAGAGNFPLAKCEEAVGNSSVAARIKLSAL